MIDSHVDQPLRVLLAQAHAAREAEHAQRLQVEQRAARLWVLLFELAQRLLANELDDL
jgi:hypothetical protein